MKEEWQGGHSTDEINSKESKELCKGLAGRVRASSGSHWKVLSRVGK
jgi:hypothetical protein